MRDVLVIEDNEDAREAMVLWLELEGFNVDSAASLREAREALARRTPQLILMDLQLPDGSSLSLLQELKLQERSEVVLITAHATLDSSIEALRLGAADYLLKPASQAQLKALLSRLMAPQVLDEEISALKTNWRESGVFGHLVGKAEPMSRLYNQLARVATTAVTVLITGESGTGKELVARSVHDLSRRRRGPFLAVNCGAISPHLIESEVFGHEKGSFTGADRMHVGFFERAAGGTLFLDEVTEMPLELQVKLLRVLETRTFMRVGSTRTQDADVRIIAATNRNPLDAVRDGKLREDLWYRLNVFPIHVPALRDRREDIAALANYFLHDICLHEKSVKRLSPSALTALESYSWPGNVRELRNAVQRAYVMTEDANITEEWMPSGSALGQAKNMRDYLEVKIGTSIAEVERRLIYATLKRFNNHKEMAAAALGVSLKTLYNRLREYESGLDASADQMEEGPNVTGH